MDKKKLQEKMKDASFDDFLRDESIRARLDFEFKKRLIYAGDCWLWYHSAKTFTFLGKHFSIARLAYALKHGTFPVGWLKKTCKIEECLNPDHTLAQLTTARTHWKISNATTASRNKAIERLFEDDILRSDLEKRFLRFIEAGPKHWIWTGACSGDNGYLSLIGKPVLARKISLGLTLKRFPSKVRVNCGIKACLNPAHLSEA